MARTTMPRPVLATLAALLIAALSATGCVSMPSGGPVQAYPMTQGTAAQNQPYVQLQPQPPRPGWGPSQIVEGFLAASASFGSGARVAREYLTPAEQKNWKINWSAIVYKSGPNVTPPAYTSTGKNPTSATVEVKGDIQASLGGNGTYVLPSGSPQGTIVEAPDPFLLQKVNNQWRISSAPQELLLTSSAFVNDYQLRNLFFFDPDSKYLVPDPIYAPLEATPGVLSLMNGLVRDLITPPAHDWLSSGATKTAFPAGTKLSGVELNGATAIVNLTGAIAKANVATMLQVSAQLLYTLQGAVQGGLNGQTVQSVEVQVNGKPWISPNGQGSPVQQSTSYHAATGASSKYYYVDGSGYLVSTPSPGGSVTRLAKIGTGYSPIAVSPDGNYVAALRGGTLYAGVVGSPLVKKGSGYSSISWDVNDDLWASVGDRIVMFRGSAGAQPLGPMVPVTVVTNSDLNVPPYTDIKVAPDGVRVAIIMDDEYLTFGAISGRLGPNPQIALSTVQYQPAAQSQPNAVSASFALSWYGPDHVIVLATPGPVVTEYSVSGGTATPISADPAMQTITSSYGQPLIAGLPKGQLASDVNLNGSWMPITHNDGTPVKGSAPAYPG